MKANYFISVRPQLNESHSVHKEDCPFLPGPGKRIFIGNFQSPHNAEEEGKKYFSSPNRCLFCSKEHYEEKTKNNLSEVNAVSNPVTSDRFKDTCENVLICSLN